MTISLWQGFFFNAQTYSTLCSTRHTFVVDQKGRTNRSYHGCFPDFPLYVLAQSIQHFKITVLVGQLFFNPTFQIPTVLEHQVSLLHKHREMHFIQMHMLRIPEFLT